MIRANLEEVAGQIENANRIAVTVPMIMAMAQENGLFGNRGASTRFAREVLIRNPGFTGAYFGYEPNADRDDGAYLTENQSEKNAMDENGRFLPYWFVNGSEIKLTPLIDMETSLYYQGTKKRYHSGAEDSAMVTEPYFYEGKMIVEQAFPIIINRKFAGIAGVDRSLTDLHRFLEGFKPYKSSKFVLISRNGKIISSNMNLASEKRFKRSLEEMTASPKNINESQLNKRMLTFNIGDTDYSGILQPFYRMEEKQRFLLMKKKGPLDARDYYFAGHRIPVGEWTVVMRVSEEEILEPIHGVLTKTALVSIIFAILLTLLILRFSRRITDPIMDIVGASAEIARGNFDISLPPSPFMEIDILTNSLTDTDNKLHSLTQKIEEEKEQLRKSETHFKTILETLHNAISNKDYTVRITPLSDEDIHAFSINKTLAALNAAAREARDQDWLKTGRNQLNDMISGERKINQLCSNAITCIAGYLNVQVGTIFIKDDEKNEFRLLASYAFGRRKGLATRFKPGEGLVGQAALEKKKILFTEVPEDYIWIKSSMGGDVPANILVVPFIYEDEVQAVMELGSMVEFTPLMIDFSDVSGSITAVAIHAALSSEKMTKLLEQTNEQANVLTDRQEELKRANAELEEQTETLRESEARLQLQQEELQASNEEMEEKNELLENQKEEIQEKARELEKATKYKAEFLAGISHELRTPLNSIMLLAKMLADNEEKNLTNNQIESAASIHRSGQNLLHLIRDILALSKIETRKIELSISRIRIQTLVVNLETEFSHMAREKGINFQTSVEQGLPDAITTDVHRLEQIMRNLLGNAFKYTEKGSVSIRVERPPEGIRWDRKDLDPAKAVAVAVTDTGPGIPEEKLRLIFEAFSREEDAIARRKVGPGLGLSISRELALLIGGELKAESTPGKGSVFTLYIPEIFTASHTEKPEAPAAEKTPRERAAAAPEGITMAAAARTMLIIEDDPEFAAILANFFQNNGYESILAPDGESGIKYVIENKPTAIILDIGLPGIDGWAVLNELKSNPDVRHIPVYIMSAFDSTREGLEKGAVGYLTKPVSTEDLKNALAKIEDVLTSQVKQLLLVEDDRELQESILKLLGTKDIHAAAVDTGEKALALLKQQRFDCMILDLGLPDISGFELLDRLNREPGMEKIPVIIYTGRELTPEETEQLERYASSIVLKSAGSFDRLLDETALFMHRVEGDMPEAHQSMIRKLRDKESILPGKKVLLVDDDMRNAYALNKFLESRGMEVTIANNGKKALDILEKKDKPDVVLMDIMMPVMDGYEAMKRIRAKKEFKDLPILALTAKAMETDREECIRCGASDYLSKPVDTNKLLSMLRVWLYQ
ncbi:MAG: response regulator [Desulfobacteraceae bacterium]|nr:response regulator [Desulfobacteraceae bacterium]